MVLSTDHWRGWGHNYWIKHGWYNHHDRDRWHYHGRPGYDRYRHHSGWDRGQDLIEGREVMDLTEDLIRWSEDR